MKIVKSSFFKPKKCEYGNFELVPENGWKISDTFIDYESKLLIVSTSILDRSKWIDNKYNYAIPTEEYKIDLSTLEILNFKDWSKFFNYETQEILSNDGKLKLISQRFYEKERNSDGIKQELYEIESNILISSSNSVAFCNWKRENLLEDYYNRIKEFEDYKKRLDQKLTLDAFFYKHFIKLYENKPIISYYNSQNTFKLNFENNKFILLKSNEIPFASYNRFHFYKFEEFYNLYEFWNFLTANKDWYKHYSLYQEFTEQPFVLTKFVFETFNHIRETQNFTYSDHDKIINWQRCFWSEDLKPSEIKQWCSNCNKEISYSGRYPKSICGDCYNKDKFSDRGELLEFSNLSFSGGFKIIYKNENGEIIREDDTQSECLCIIDNKEFVAQEARFGGITIQKK